MDVRFRKLDHVNLRKEVKTGGGYEEATNR